MNLGCEKCGGERSANLSVCLPCAIRRPEGPEPEHKPGGWRRVLALVSNERERS